MSDNETPKDLEDCFRILSRELSKTDLARVKAEDSWKFHHNLGMYLRNTWGLWHNPRGAEETEIHKYMKGLGLHHADDMSGLILESFRRHLNKEPLDIEGQIAEYQAYWADKKEK